MSTRSQIKLKESTDNIHVYKHSDGYPEGVLPVLVPFVKEFMASRGYDECYLLAQVVRRFAVTDYLDQKLFEERHPQLSPHDTTRDFLGWGLDCEKHGDIDYLYEIDKTGAIFVNGKKLTEKEMNKYTTNKTA